MKTMTCAHDFNVWNTGLNSTLFFSRNHEIRDVPSAEAFLLITLCFILNAKCILICVVCPLSASNWFCGFNTEVMKLIRLLLKMSTHWKRFRIRDCSHSHHFNVSIIKMNYPCGIRSAVYRLIHIPALALEL